MKLLKEKMILFVAFISKFYITSNFKYLVFMFFFNVILHIFDFSFFFYKKFLYFCYVKLKKNIYTKEVIKYV